MIANGRTAAAMATTRPPNPALPFREDCWSEGETSTLVDAWGDHYVELNRGNLRQKHWQEVADAVNFRRAAFRRPPRTDVQCKNRIDTIKKKYKSEKLRISATGAASQWPFYDRLDALIGASASDSSPASAGTAAKKSTSRSMPLSLPFPFVKKDSPLPAAAAAAAAAAAFRPIENREKRPIAGIPVNDLIFRRAQAAAAAAVDDEEEDDDEEEELGSPSLGSSSRSGKGLRRGREMMEGGDGIREVAKAIANFADIYERVEASKQRHMMDLEKQRMEFAKSLEFQRMHMFVDSQVQLEKMKRAKKSDTDSYL